MESRHVSTDIDRPPAEVYDFAADPANWPHWAAGLGSRFEQVDGQWVAESPTGRVVVGVTDRNTYGVLDHDVTLPSGETVYNPMRVIADDAGGCEVVFTVRRRPQMTDADFQADIDAVAADLATLKRVLEAR